MGEAVTLEEALAFVRQLSPVNKARLIERMVPEIERELRAARSTPYVSLRGLWRGLDMTEDEINQAREEMWSEFPREDV
ncbi:MAG: hypothetical protein JSV81_05300 [Anaerolineales bacterium]|nr:MAG: hypothetical protein JSV81_05300 [Anaerolineales bacterium]